MKAEKSFTFSVEYTKTKVIFTITESTIKIYKRVSNGKVKTYEGADEFRIDMIARYISIQDLWKLRTSGFADKATEIRKLQRTYKFT